MDFHSVMETFAEAWVAANTHTPLTVAAEQGLINGPANHSPVNHVPNTQIQIQTQPVLTVLQEPSKQPTEPITISENSRICGRQSPTDSPSNCSSICDMRPYKAAETQGKSLPVHCIVEQIPGPDACGRYVELDSYAIVPNDTLFSDLVRTALGKLGYSGAQILGAKGSIQVKKWKPLAFDQVTENPEATVGDILGDLTTMASLHVRLYSVPDDPHEWKDITVRNAVLELLREMSQSKLAKLCPLSQPMLSNIINNRYMGKIGKDKCLEFGQWYLSYRKDHPETSTPEVVPSDKPVDGRLTFHPTKELPIMRDWFQGCRNPSRRTLQMYVDILNQSPVRQQERPKIAFSTLKNWWKNEKQRERKNLKSDDNSPESTKPKRRKKSDPTPDPNSTSGDAGLQNYSGSSSQDTPPKSNNFTLINHVETDSELDRFGRRDAELCEGHLMSDSSHPFHRCQPMDIGKSNGKFTLLGHDIEKHVRCDVDISDHRLNGNLQNTVKDSIPVESPFFQKLHNVCLEHPHSLFGFNDSHLGIQNGSKMFCDNGVRTSIMDGSTGHLSSEEDVDVGI